MNVGKLVFAQLMDHLPWKSFGRIVQHYDGNHRVRHFSCADHFRCMAFAQLTFRESLRDIEACLRAQQTKLYHLGIHARVSRTTLADANEARDWRIYADFAQRVMAIGRRLYADEPFGLELQHTVYALDATLIRLCLSMFPWAAYRQTTAAVKMHTLMDLRGSIPAFIHVSDGLLHEMNVLDQLVPEAGSFYVMDRGYIDFTRLHRFHQAGAFFVIRARANLNFKRRYSARVDRTTGLVCDQTITLNVYRSREGFPERLRRIKVRDAQSGKVIVLLTNNFTLPALTIGELYRCRWQVELFFKWIKQHLRIKAFFGTSEQAVKTQIWIAVSVYVLVAIVKKRLRLNASLYELLQILSLTMFERIPLDQLLTLTPHGQGASRNDNQLNLFEF
ncbi:MAG: IS4 family transposase [Actinobacteria bacterium]|nr:IS4 family transposase [Actinomycetota bacterium]